MRPVSPDPSHRTPDSPREARLAADTERALHAWDGLLRELETSLSLPAGVDVTAVTGSGGGAQENRAIRTAQAVSARGDAQALQERLASVADRAQQMSERAGIMRGLARTHRRWRAEGGRPVVAATSLPTAIGTFRRHPGSGVESWDAAMFGLHRCDAGVLRPGRDLLLARTHPDDVRAVATATASALRGGHPFAVRYRVRIGWNPADGVPADPDDAVPEDLDAPDDDDEGRLMVGFVDGQGRATAVRGVVVDLDPTPPGGDAAVDPVTERAVGAMMAVLAIGEEPARVLLAWSAAMRGTSTTIAADALVMAVVHGRPRPAASGSTATDDARTGPADDTLDALLRALDPDQAPGSPPTGSVSAVLRRAIAHLDAHAADDLDLDELALVVGVGPRALQLAFRRELDTTPTAYLRSVRLARAHRDLSRADPRLGDTVAAVATAWHFTHHGLFARYYREAYGCTPSRTLRG